MAPIALNGHVIVPICGLVTPWLLWQMFRRQ